MKTLTVNITDKDGKRVAWCRMSSARRFREAVPETGGPQAAYLPLPTAPSDLESLGCVCAGAAANAGLDWEFVWEGLWDIEPPGPAET